MRFIIPAASLVVAVFALPKDTPNQEIYQFLQEFNEKQGKLNNILTVASWNYNTNLTDENAEVELKANKELEQYNAEAFKTVQGFDLSSIENDPELKRQLKKVNIEKYF